MTKSLKIINQTDSVNISEEGYLLDTIGTLCSSAPTMGRKRNASRDGKGIEKLVDGSSYEGLFREGRQEGHQH